MVSTILISLFFTVINQNKEDENRNNMLKKLIIKWNQLFKKFIILKKHEFNIIVKV